MTKNIALFIDGTWNKPASKRHPEITNVRKLFEHTPCFCGPPQITKYLRGVGTDAWTIAGEPDGSLRSRSREAVQRVLTFLPRKKRNALGGLFGWGTTDRIKEAYEFLSRNYERRDEDRVFMFGFSRGAFALRSLAGFIDTVGLLLKDKLESVEEAYALYESGTDPAQSPLREYLVKITGKAKPDSERGETLPIHFIGVWDTVGALGLPWRLRALTARYTDHHVVAELPSNVYHARHALALHELRKLFNPLLWILTDRTSGQSRSLRQVWFPGAHADVGGGYPEMGLSDAALVWMANEAKKNGLDVDPPLLNKEIARPDESELHHEIRKWFVLCTPTIRPELCKPSHVNSQTMKTFYIHKSVCDRLVSEETRRYRFLQLGVNSVLGDIDELSLKLHFKLSFNHGKIPVGISGNAVPEGSMLNHDNVGDWWNHTDVTEVRNAKHVVDAYVQTPGASQEESRREFARSLSLMILCGGGEALEKFLNGVGNALMRTSSLVVKDHNSLDVFKKNWLVRFDGISDDVDCCVSILPFQWRSTTCQVSDTIRERWDRLYLEYKLCRLRAGWPGGRIPPVFQIKGGAEQPIKDA